MKRALIPLALIAPLALAACDDGADRISELERELETQRTSVETSAGELTNLRTELDTANARVVELETAAADGGTSAADLEAANARIAELETSTADITTMQKDLETANARVVELETAAADSANASADLEAANARIVELEAAAADGTNAGTELEAANARIAELEANAAELETANARIAELEAASTAPVASDPVDPAGGAAAADLSEPMTNLVQSLREHQAALIDLQATVTDDPSARALADAALKNMRVIGRDLQAAIEAAGVTVE